MMMMVINISIQPAPTVHILNPIGQCSCIAYSYSMQGFI